MAVPDWHETWQREYDAKPERLSLYTTIKNDHPELWLSEEPCDCQTGGTGWERLAAMSIRFPGKQADREAGG